MIRNRLRLIFYVITLFILQEFLSDTDNDPTDQELSSDDKEMAARIANSRRGPIEVPPITVCRERLSDHRHIAGNYPKVTKQGVNYN